MPPVTSRLPWSPLYLPWPAPSPSSSRQRRILILLRAPGALRSRGPPSRGLSSCPPPYQAAMPAPCSRDHATGNQIRSVPRLQGAAERRVKMNEAQLYTLSTRADSGTQTHLAHLCQEARPQNGRCGVEGGTRSGRNARGAESHLPEVRRRKRLPGVSGTRKRSTGRSHRSFCTGTKTSDVSTDQEDGKEAETVSMTEKTSRLHARRHREKDVLQLLQGHDQNLTSSEGRGCLQGVGLGITGPPGTARAGGARFPVGCWTGLSAGATPTSPFLLLRTLNPSGAGKTEAVPTPSSNTRVRRRRRQRQTDGGTRECDAQRKTHVDAKSDSGAAALKIPGSQPPAGGLMTARSF